MCCYCAHSANNFFDVNKTGKVGDFGFANEVPKLVGGCSFYSMKVSWISWIYSSRPLDGEGSFGIVNCAQ